MHGALRHPVRVAGRLSAFMAVSGSSIIDHIWRLRRAGMGADPRSCAEWLQTWSRRTLSGIGIGFQHHGTVPSQGIVVCNHLSYLDITVLAASGPMVFVSKADVQRWPYLGTLARCGGTLFLQRERRGHVAEIARAFKPIIEGGTVVTIFPEGTSSGGDSVLPFRSSLLEPAAAHGWPVTPAWITYDLDDGTVSDDVAYWRDMTFAPHFLNLLSKRAVTGHVHYGEPITGVSDRKQLTRQVYGAVVALMESARSGSPAAGSMRLTNTTA